MKRGRHVRGCRGRSGWSLPVAQAGCELDMHGDILPNPLQAFATDPQHFSPQLPNEAGAAGDRTGSM